METDERFWSQTDRSGDCWTWLGTRRKDGYGLFWDGVRQARAHRFAYELTNGPIPPNLSVCHSCDNPPCVRPTHLFLGTQRDNLADMTAKGRRAIYVGRPQKGVLNNATHLTEADVAYIRGLVRAGHYHGEIAPLFGIDRATISYIALGKTWIGIEPIGPFLPVDRTRYTPKLAPKDRAAIRAAYTGTRGQKTEMARQYGVSVPAIRNVLRG